jgi:tartrate dehydrogenase/decarboxylase/D-malate dehydrogenase
VPDHVSLWGSILKIRREFDQYVNLRPVRLFEGVPSPLTGKQPGDLDFWIVRENTEGEYTDIGGIMFEGTDRELVLQQSVHTRYGSDRVLNYALALAAKTDRKHLTVATKSNGLAVSMPWWDERAKTLAQAYPEVTISTQHIDALSARFVLKPETLDIVVGPNLFGDILSDLGPACAGTLGIAPSANLNPDGVFPSLFEPVHGSAPDIAGQNIANPIGAIWSAAMLLEYSRNTGELHHQAANAIMQAIQLTLKGDTLTRDLRGEASTQEMTDALIQKLRDI